jgi:4-amino-4-deoxy-L-arabinose transferase-like glycosyltransferase
VSRFRRLILILVAVAVVGAVLATFTPRFEYEELVREFLARYILSRGLGYLNKVAQPPFGLIVEATLFLVGAGIRMQRALSVFFSVVSVYLTFKIARLKLSENDALYATVLVAFNPLFIIYSFTASAESLTLMLFLLFCYFFYSEHYLSASLALFLGVLTHYSIWPLVPLTLLSFVSKRRRLKTLLPLAAGVSGVVLWGALNYIQTSNPTYFIENLHATTERVFANYNVFNLNGFEFLLPMFVYPLTFSGPFLIKTLANLKRKREISLPLLFVATNTLLLTIGVITKTTMPWARYYLYNLPLLVMLGYPSKIKLWHIIAYFALATAATYLQVVWSINFYNQLSS